MTNTYASKIEQTLASLNLSWNDLESLVIFDKGNHSPAYPGQRKSTAINNPNDAKTILERLLFSLVVDLDSPFYLYTKEFILFMECNDAESRVAVIPRNPRPAEIINMYPKIYGSISGSED